MTTGVDNKFTNRKRYNQRCDEYVEIAGGSLQEFPVDLFEVHVVTGVILKS